MAVTTDRPPHPKAAYRQHASAAPAIDVRGVSRAVGARTLLNDVSFSIQPGELVAVAGGSGAGKTTLLQAMAGVRAPDTGRVLVNGASATDAGSSGIGYVPQDDIIHLELPLRRTLEYAAELRIPDRHEPGERAALVDRTLGRLDLCDREQVTVADLSGGQRKRASIAAELLTEPSLLYLDEPTSGLDPATSASVMADLRRLADTGTTVVLTTHAPADLARCDRVVFLAADGHLVFDGAPDDALAWFEVERLAEIYEAVAAHEPATLAVEFERSRALLPATGPGSGQAETRARRVAPSRQWGALTRRTSNLLLRNRLTLAILVGSPAMVVGMMALLFQTGTFGPGQSSPVPAIQTLFWIAFASFFFGLTYGLLQIVGELEIFRRERFNGLSVRAYVLSKVAILLPVLVGVNVIMLAVLRGLDRLPPLAATDWAELLVTLSLTSIAALAIGLLASAAVQNASQATMALPMLCFPQVLFAGAVVPVSEMATAGRVMSYGLVDRWGFEATGRTLAMPDLIGDDRATAGYVGAFTGSVAPAWLILGAITVVALGATEVVLRRRS